MTLPLQGTVQREHKYVYGDCSLCSDTNVLVYLVDNKLVCAEDYRKIVRTFNYVQHCDKCDATPAMRDPSHRRNEYLCWSCHTGNGFVVDNSVVKRALTAISYRAKLISNVKLECFAAGYGTDCDNNLKPRSTWGGKILCNKHGKTPPKPEKGKKS